MNYNPPANPPARPPQIYQSHAMAGHDLGQVVLVAPPAGRGPDPSAPNAGGHITAGRVMIAKPQEMSQTMGTLGRNPPDQQPVRSTVKG